MKKKIIRIMVSLLFLVISIQICGNRAEAEEGEGEGQGEGKVIAIDAGHQLKGNSEMEPNGPGSKTMKAKVTSGTSGCATGTPEHKLNLKVAKKLKKELEARGYEVVMVRTKDKVNISNAERAKVANKAKVDAFIRIHANSSESSSVSGALTIAPTGKNKYMSKNVRKESQKLSKKVLKKFCEATGAQNRGVMYTDTMTGINWCTVPVTIIEMGFMSNSNEDKKMGKASYQKKMVQGIADGIDAYLK